LTEEAQAVARITGYQPTSQFFLVRATNQQQLLERQTALSGAWINWSTWASSRATCRSASWSPALRTAQVREALNGPPCNNRCSTSACRRGAASGAENLQALPVEDIDARWPARWPNLSPLWLGPTDDGVAAMVSLQGLNNPACCACRRWICPACNWSTASVS
jgi:hypothetical protein